MVITDSKETECINTLIEIFAPVECLRIWEIRRNWNALTTMGHVSITEYIVTTSLVSCKSTQLKLCKIFCCIFGQLCWQHYKFAMVLGLLVTLSQFVRTFFQIQLLNCVSCNSCAAISCNQRLKLLKVCGYNNCRPIYHVNIRAMLLKNLVSVRIQVL